MFSKRYVCSERKLYHPLVFSGPGLPFVAVVSRGASLTLRIPSSVAVVTQVIIAKNGRRRHSFRKSNHAFRLRR
jgi:hypothetical protein